MGLLLLNGESGLNPRELFSNNEQGLWLDPSDMTAGKAGWRRNLLTYSEQFDNSVWAKLNATATANATPAPDGTSTAEKIFENSTGNVERVVYPPSPPTVTVATYTFSVYAKASENIWIYVRCDNGTSSGAWFNLQTGAVGTVEAGISAAITNAGNGWYRCSVTKTLSAGTGYGAFQLANADNVKSYVGVVNNGIFVWGAQLELGSTPTEYQRITDFSTEFKAAFPTHTLYQDSNGVTPCTAAGDPVGLILDQSRGGLSQIGADLVTNGGFAADSDWTKGANWTIGSGVATKTGGAANNLTQTISSTAAAWYRISLDVTRSAGTLTISIGTSGTTYAITATGSYTFFILAGSGTQTLTLEGDSSFAGTVDNVVVRSVPGNHAYQTTSGARPTLARIPSSGRRNLLTRTEEFDNAAWGVGAVSVTANNAIAPDGTTTADTVTESATTDYHRLSNSNISRTSGITYTLSVYAKLGTGTRFLIINSASAINAMAAFNLSTGAVHSTTSGSAAIQSVGGGWYRCSVTGTATITGTSTIYFQLDDNGTDGTYAGDGTSSLYLWGAQLETGSTATSYQKVVATTDVTESGVGDLWHLVFDGSDDSLTTNSVDMTGTDEMTVIAGVRKLSDAARGIIVELSASTGANAGSFLIAAPDFALNDFGSYSRGEAVVSALSSAIAAPATRVVSFYSDISQDSLTQRINGTNNGSSSNDQGTGNFGNYQLYIGRRGGTTLPYNGHLYQLIIRGKTTPTGKLLEAERFVGRKTGVTF